MDAIDRQLLTLLRSDGRMPTTTLAKRVGLARSSVQERLDRLQRDGIIRGFSVVTGSLSPDAVQAYLMVKVSENCARLQGLLRAIPEILSAHSITGEDDLLIYVETATAEGLARVRNLVEKMPSVVRVTTSLVLNRWVDRPVQN
jgi:DNA-binding Lrp family transcriptional regulator